MPSMPVRKDALQISVKSKNVCDSDKVLKNVDVLSKTKPLAVGWKCSKMRAQWRGTSDGGGLRQKDLPPLIKFSKTHPSTHNSDTYSHKEKEKNKKKRIKGVREPDLSEF